MAGTERILDTLFGARGGGRNRVDNGRQAWQPCFEQYETMFHIMM